MSTELAIQCGLLAQGPNFEDMGDLLFIVIVAVLWLAGGLAKVLSSRKGAQQPPRREGETGRQTRQRETWQERLKRKAEEMQRAAEARARQVEEQARARTRTVQHPAGKITVRTDQKGDSVMVYERPAAGPPTRRQQHGARQRDIRPAVRAARERAVSPPPIEPKIEGILGSEPLVESMADLIREPPKPLEPTVIRSAPPRGPTGGFSAQAIIDYSDPDALRKAILHYEILGKPLALREPPQDRTLF